MGTRATKGLERLIFGSTAEAVFRKSPCPVLTVNASWRSGTQTSNNPIVFATEFQDDKTRCSKFAIAMANAFDTTLHFVHVLPSPVQDTGDCAESIMLDGLKCLTSHGGLCAHLPVCKVLHGTDVSQSIVEYAVQNQAQAIILSVRSTSRVAAHLPPQRTYRIMMLARCPVITISDASRKRTDENAVGNEDFG